MSDQKDGTRKTTFRFPIDFDLQLNEEWEDLESSGSCSERDGRNSRSDTARTFSLGERPLPTRVINRTPPESDSWNDPPRREFTPSYVDFHIPIGMGDEPFPHSVPIVGLRSSRSSGVTTGRSLAAVSRCQSARGPAQSPSTKLVRSSSARTISGPSASRVPSGRASARPLSGKPAVEFRPSKSASRATSARASSRSGKTSRRSLSCEKSARASSSGARNRTYRSSSGSSSPVSAKIPAHSGRPLPVFPSVVNNRTGVKRTWSYASEAPGYWEAVGSNNEVHLGNIGVWALTDPPEPPPGIYWKKVTPPASPTPLPSQPDAVVEPAENEGGGVCQEPVEEEVEDATCAPSAIVPELVPSADPVQPVVKVIRKVVLVPTPAQKGYPGFCDSSEALQALKAKKSTSEESLGAKKRQLVREKENMKRPKQNTKLSEEQIKEKVPENNKRNSIITPSAWKTGLKWAKKELGPKKSCSASSNLNNGSVSATSEKNLEDKLNDIHKFVNETENKISDVKCREVNESEIKKTASEAHVFSKDINKSINIEGEKSEDLHDMKKPNDEKVLSSLSEKDMLTHVLSKGDSIQIDKRNYAGSKDEEVVSPIKGYSQLENLKKSGRDRNLQTKSAHNLNNAFIRDEEYKIPKKSNSLSNFSSKPDIKSLEDVPLKCPQPSKHYDPKKIKEYIRVQKQLRHKKMLEEKEMKKVEDEKKKAKLLDLRSKSKELVEVSVKRRSAILKQQIEDLQRTTVDVVDTLQIAPLVGVTERSEVPSEGYKSEKNYVPSSGPGERKNSSPSHSDESAKPRVIDKPVSHVGLQTGDSLVELEPENTKIELALESEKLVSSLRLPSLIGADKQPSAKSDRGVREHNKNEKSDTSRSESCRVILDKKTCSSIQREVKKLAHNIYVLEKHKMIGIFPDKPIPQPGPTQRNEFEISERQVTNLKNTNSTLWEVEQQMCAKNSIPTHVFQSNNLLPNVSLNSANPWGSTQHAHQPLEKPTNTKSSANNIAFNVFPTRNTSAIRTPQVNKAVTDNNFVTTDKPHGISHFHQLSSSSLISEGPLLDEDLNNTSDLKGTQLNNLCDPSHAKRSEESKNKEMPFWLQNLSMESRPFNFISAVKMKLNKFLEEQNEENDREIPSKLTPSLKPDLHEANIENLVLPSDKLVSEEKFTVAPIEKEVLYDSDFETSARSSTVPNQVTMDNVADSSDLDTATEDILPTDKAPKPPVSPPKPIEVMEIQNDSLSEDTSEEKTSQSTTSVQSSYSHFDYKLVAPHISLSRSLSSHTSRSLESSKSETTRSLPKDTKNLKIFEGSNKEGTLSIPDEVSVSSAKSEGSLPKGRGKEKISSILDEVSASYVKGQLPEDNGKEMTSGTPYEVSASHAKDQGPRPEDNDKEESSSIPDEVSALFVKDQGSSVESSKTKKFANSKAKVIGDEGVVPAVLSPDSVRKYTDTTISVAPVVESSSKFKDAISSSSSEADIRIFSRSHASSIQETFHAEELYLPTSSHLQLQTKNRRATQETVMSGKHSPKLHHEGNMATENSKKLNDNHAEKLAEMERKAFEHRMEMERAFEKERLKLELALAEAKRTVFDSKLEATKFISDAAVELIKSQAEVTKANAEATKHLSEAKVMDSLKVETIVSQSASTAALSAIEAAIKELKSFVRVKHTPKKLAHSISAEQSETSSVSSEASHKVFLDKDIDGLSNVNKKMSQEISESEKKSELSVAEQSNVEENVDESVEKEDTVVEELENYPEDSSIPSISENISEKEYSSKFEDTASETEVKTKTELKYETLDAVKNLKLKTKGNTENKKVAPKRKHDVTDKHNLDTSTEMQGFSGYPDINEESYNSGKDSFTKFSLSMFQQLMMEEEMRAQHQQALLKLREDTLIGKTKAEMTLLELKKKHSREKGQDDIVSSIRKKQRGMLIKLKLERDEIQRLKKSHKAASHERRIMLIQQQHIIKMRMSTKEIMNKLQTKKLPPTPKAIRSMGLITSALDSSRSSVDVKTEESALVSRTQSNAAIEELPSLDATHSDASIPTEPAHSSHPTASDSEDHKDGKCDVRVLEKEVIHGLNDLEKNKKFLSEREKNLIHRRQAVEELLLWRKRLELEEERVRALESKAMVAESPSFKPYSSYLDQQDFAGLKADRSTSPLQIDAELKMREDAATSMADFSSAHSESILEDVPSQLQKSSVSVADEVESDLKKIDQFDNDNLPSPSSESVVNTQMSAEQQSKEENYSSLKEVLEGEKDSKSMTPSMDPVGAKDDSKASSLNITIKSPLTPYFVGRQRRRHSSGSDDSIILSQNETASEQSDIESKICALQEQLRRRKMEADLLKKEQKRCHRERLKAKEQSLIKQIQAYDSYIQRAHKELEQEYESPTASLVKPQIKQRRNWKKKADASKEVMEIPDKNSSVDSISEAMDKVSPTVSVMEKTEKVPSIEEIVKTASLVEVQNDESKIVPDVDSRENLSGSQTQDNSMGSLTEVMEEIPALTEDLPLSENSPLSLSRGSSLETTIESPTKHNNQAESLNVVDIEDKGDLKKVAESVESNATKPLSDSPLIEQNDLSHMVESNKSDKYDEDTFEHTSDAHVEMKEVNVENHSEDAQSSICPVSEEIIEELSHNSSNELPEQSEAEESAIANLTPEKTTANENESSPKDMPVKDIVDSQPEHISEEPISLPSYIFSELPSSQVGINETFVVSKEVKEYEKEADEITEGIFQNLFEESVVEAEILRNKNSTYTLELADCNEKVSELSPLYEPEDYEKIEEQKHQLSSNEEEIKIVSICLEECKAQTVTKVEGDNNRESTQVAPKESLICDLLMQLILDDVVLEFMEINEKRKSMRLDRKGSVVLGSPREGHEKMTGEKRNSDVMKRVQQIMLESSLSQVSPREKSRPQDLMITTYDVLSPDSSTCNSPVLGPSEMESMFEQVEKVSSKSSQKQQEANTVSSTGGKPIQFLQVEHGGNLGASSGSGGSTGADNEAFSQDWFEEDFGLNSSLREVEEIQLQQLQIEREIEQLQLAQAKEQQQRTYPYNFYIREIPNKPPPPYTPPEETPRLSTAIGGPISPLGTPRDPSPRAAVPTEQEEVASLLQSAIGEFYDCWNRGESLDSVDMPPSFQCTIPEESEENLSERSIEEMLQKKSRWSYSQFLFDLSRQLVDEALDNVEGEKWVSVPTKFGSQKLKPTLPLPSRKCFVDEVVKQGLITLGFIPRETRDNIMFSWTLKKRDRIDEILMREVQEEDRYWTNFDEEEKYLKEQLAESLFELLLMDTSKAVAVAFEGKAQRMSGADG